jgi:hypothetical protein
MFGSQRLAGPECPSGGEDLSFASALLNSTSVPPTTFPARLTDVWLGLPELFAAFPVYASGREDMKTLLLFIVLAALAGMAFADVDVSGKWTGSFNPTGANGETKESTAVLILKQSGAEITGTVGPNDDEQYPIKNGRIEGNKITLEADHDGHTLKLELVLAAERLTGEAHMSREGENMKAKIDVSRAK